MVTTEVERAEEMLLEALQRLGSEPDAAVGIAIEAVRRAAASIPTLRLREERFSELAFKLRSLERALKASRARLRISASGVEREQALKDAKADLEEALALVKQLAERGLQRPPLELENRAQRTGT